MFACFIRSHTILTPLNLEGHLDRAFTLPNNPSINIIKLSNQNKDQLEFLEGIIGEDVVQHFFAKQFWTENAHLLQPAISHHSWKEEEVKDSYS